MKPAKFTYHAPTTIEEAIELLGRYNGDARPLAGGQTLLPMMNLRIATPAALVDLNQIKELDGIREHDSFVEIGAITRFRQLEFSQVIAARLPLLTEALSLIAHLPIRTRGTIGGSLANSDPAAEMPMLLRLLDGKIVARGSAGERIIEAEDFFVDLMTTGLMADEIITAVRFPCMPTSAGYAIEEFARRHGDFALVAVAAVVVVNGQSPSVRLAATGIGSFPLRMKVAEEHLERTGIDDASIEEAGRIVSDTVRPMSDRHASAAYRRHLAGVLSSRVIRRAIKMTD